MHKRLPDWQPRLTQYLASYHGQRFVRGKYDCAMFAAGAVQAMTGVDVAKGLRGYRSEAEGLRKAAKKGFTDHIAYTASIFAETANPVAGDLAVFEYEGREALGVFQGRCIIAMALTGVVPIPTSDLTKAFEVPF